MLSKENMNNQQSLFAACNFLSNILLSFRLSEDSITQVNKAVARVLILGLILGTT